MKSLSIALIGVVTLMFQVPVWGATQPNILFIGIDDLNDWIGCLEGHPQALTPNIDRLAVRGVLFTNAHCASPACRPSRAALLTGMMPDKTGVWSNESKALEKQQPGAIKLPVPFAKAGYKTMGTGKLNHGKDGGGFEEYVWVEQRWGPITRKLADYTKKELPSKGSANPRHVVKDSTGRDIVLPLNRIPSDRAPNKVGGESFDWGAWDVPDSDFGDTQITDWAIRKLEQESDSPTFLALGYYRPHIPLWAPKRFFDRFKDDPGKLPPYKKDDLDDLSETAKRWAVEAVTAGAHKTVLEYGEWEEAVEGYLACVSYIDHEVGRLLDALDRSPMKDNTIIVLWSDHGWHLGEKEHWGKWTGWERSTRVPLIIVPPKNQAKDFAPAGSRCEQPVGLIDLFPTLTDLCGVEAPKGLDGQSVAPLLRDPASATGRRVITTFDPGNFSVRSDRYRYILYSDGSEELYDVKADPNEWENLAGRAEHRNLIKRLRGDL